MHSRTPHRFAGQRRDLAIPVGADFVPVEAHILRRNGQAVRTVPVVLEDVGLRVRQEALHFLPGVRDGLPRVFPEFLASNPAGAILGQLDRQTEQQCERFVRDVMRHAVDHDYSAALVHRRVEMKSVVAGK